MVQEVLNHFIILISKIIFKSNLLIVPNKFQTTLYSKKIRDMFSHISNFYCLAYFLFFNTANVIVIPAIRIKAIAPPNT